MPMHSVRTPAGRLLEQRDDEARTFSRYSPEDGSLIESRPYTDEENAQADAYEAESALVEARLELERAIALSAGPDILARVQRLTLASAGIAEGAAWRQPTGAHDAYPIDFQVSHNGKQWTSTMDGNVWEPGVSGWREVVESGYPEYVQPTGAHDAYGTGDRVRFNGACWESTIDGNVWSPAALPSGWTGIPCP